MFPSSQVAAGLPLHSRNTFAPAVSSSPASVEKDPLSADGRYSASTPPPNASTADGATDILALSSSNAANGGSMNGSSQPIITPMIRARDRICFQHLLMTAAVAFAAAVFCVWCAWRATADSSIDATTGKVLPYTFPYFIYCLLGGVVAGTVHVLVTPIDVVKCRVQVGEYRSFRDGFHHLYYAEADKSVMRALPLFFRGWVPTAWGYCIQGALKFSLYEVFKYVLLIGPLARMQAAAAASTTTTLDPAVPPLPSVHSSNGSDANSIYHSGVFQLVMFLLSSSAAEVIADLGLAPWEAVKIRMQTSSSFPTSLRAALPRMWEAEGLHGFYKGLVPLWCRQVPYTMMKFASFEMIVVALASAMSSMGLLDLEHPSTLGKLVVSLLAGVLAGVLCGLISHPADTVLSKLNQRGSAAMSGGNTNAPLLATTIAAARNAGAAASSGTLHDISVLLRDLGWRGVWKGLAPRLLMVSTLTALQWVTYDGFKVFVGLPTSGGVGH